MCFGKKHWKSTLFTRKLHKAPSKCQTHSTTSFPNQQQLKSRTSSCRLWSRILGCHRKTGKNPVHPSPPPSCQTLWVVRLKVIFSDLCCCQTPCSTSGPCPSLPPPLRPGLPPLLCLRGPGLVITGLEQGHAACIHTSGWSARMHTYT